MAVRDELLRTGSEGMIWQKYCGFLDLSLPEVMEIQKELLTQQIDQVNESALAKRFMPQKPKDVLEFRRSVRLTTFDDYADELNKKNEDVLAIKPYCWGHTSGRGGAFKWIPYTDGAIDMLIIYGNAVGIVACASKKGEINIRSGLRLLQNLPPPPYMAGIVNQLFQEVWDARIIPPTEKYKDADFETKIRAGFEIALSTGVDLVMSLTSVLVKMGEGFTTSSRQQKLSWHLLHPKVIRRLISARLQSKREGRALLPKDLWPAKGLVCYGTDTSIYRDKLRYYWGLEPTEAYAASEAGIIALQAWNKKNMTFTPASCFLEFIPESEWLKSREDESYQPPTLLLDEVQVGQRYELVITNFYGMPFLRYRLGDLVRIIALEDEETGIKLPQMAFESRADDIIDIAGFPRLDEKTMWQVIASTGLEYEDWSARKEYEQSEPVIRLYIELREKTDEKDLERRAHEELVRINRDYRDLQNMLGIQPLRVTILPEGTFQRYTEEKQKAGFDLAHLKPRHTNAPDDVIQDLIRLAETLSI